MKPASRMADWGQRRKTVLADDTFGRSSAKGIAAAGVDVAGVTFARPRRGFVVIDARGGANQVPSDAEEDA